MQLYPQENLNVNSLKKNYFERNSSYEDKINLLKPFNHIINPRSIIKKYNSKIKLDSMITYRSDQSILKYIYTHDVNGNISYYIISFWNVNKWDTVFRITNTYDSLGNLISELSEILRYSKWENFTRNNYTFDFNGNKIMHLVEGWDDYQWINLSRTIYVYDSHNNLVMNLTEDWVDNSWINHFRQTYFYNFSGYRDSSLFEIWKGNEWIKKYRVIHGYDTKGNLTSSFGYQWAENQWANFLFQTYNYDFNGNRDLEFTKIWDGGKWVNYFRSFYTYNTFNYFIHGLSEIYQNSIWLPADGLMTAKNPDGNIVGDYGKEIFLYYSTSTGFVDENKLQAYEYELFQNFPNPFNHITTIKYKISLDEPVKLKVYDILGREISTLVNEIQYKGTYEVAFNASRLQSGVYIYRIESGSFKKSKMMIYQK